MELNRNLYRLAKDLRKRHRSMEEVAFKLGAKAKTVRNWKNSKRITITPEMINGLNNFGYDIRLVTLDPQKQTKPGRRKQPKTK